MFSQLFCRILTHRLLRTPNEGCKKMNENKKHNSIDINTGPWAGEARASMCSSPPSSFMAPPKCCTCNRTRRRKCR